MSTPPEEKSTKRSPSGAADSGPAQKPPHDSLGRGSDSPQIPKTSYELRIFQSLRRIIRAIEIHSQKLAQTHQITGPQLGCILAIGENGSLTTTKLAQTVFLSPSTVVGIVDRLEKKGLVARTRGLQDRRQVQIGLTESGKLLAQSAPSPLQDTLADALKGLPELEQVSITLALEKVVDLMEAGRIEAAPVLETGPLSSALPKKPPTGS